MLMRENVLATLLSVNVLDGYSDLPDASQLAFLSWRRFNGLLVESECKCLGISRKCYNSYGVV